MSIDWLGNICLLKTTESRSISAENPTGAVGQGGKEKSVLGEGRKGRPQITLAEGEITTIADISGPGMITHIWCTVPDRTQKADFVLRNLLLRIFWDDEDTPSVVTPLGDFFCCGFGARCTISSIPITVAPVGGCNSYWPMPFRKRARITIENLHPEEVKGFFYTIDYTIGNALDEKSAYFHAQWRRTQENSCGKDHVILETRGRGHYVGTYLAWASLGRYWWGEGEIKFYLDDDTIYPTICGTGVEDYFGGAWCYWEPSSEHGSGHVATYSTPFLGYPYHSQSASHPVSHYASETVPSHGLYRWHLPDPITFSKRMKVTVQAIGHDGRSLFERSDDIASTAYWYQTEPHSAFPESPNLSLLKPR